MRMSFGALDKYLDNDMQLDLFIANGHVYPATEDIVKLRGALRPNAEIARRRLEETTPGK